MTVVKRNNSKDLKDLAKAKAEEAIKATDFKSKLPKDAEVTVGDVTEKVLAKLTAEKEQTQVLLTYQ